MAALFLGLRACLGLFLFLLECSAIQRDFVSSTLNTRSLLNIHNQIIPSIHIYKDAIDNLSQILNSFLSDPSLSYLLSEWETDGDPLRTYHLIKRTYSDIDKIIQASRNVRASDPVFDLENLRTQNLLPSAQDFVGITKAVVRLQQLYHLNPSRLALGEITNQIHLPVKLTARDCLALGKGFQKYGKGPNTVQKVLESSLWFSTGLALAKQENFYDSQVIREKLESRLENISSQISNADYVDHVYNPRLLDSKAPWDIVQTNYRRLCRGERLRSAALDVNCVCHLRRGPHPYLKLRPLKVEVLSRDPYLIVMHDFLGDRDMKFLKTTSLAGMGPSTTESGKKFVQTEQRISVTSWITDTSTRDLNRRLEAFTGLGTNTSRWEVEQYQVLNYGVGGHYTPHQDYSHNPDIQQSHSGGRIATLMIYLSDVEAGGATAFPHIGVTIFPKKGSAAFWWNLRGDCGVEPLTMHGACPVLYGTKWVTNKWYLRHAQMFKAPCGPSQRHTLFQL